MCLSYGKQCSLKCHSYPVTKVGGAIISHPSGPLLLNSSCASISCHLSGNMHTHCSHFILFFLFLTLSRLQLIANVTGVDQKVNFWMQHDSLRLPSPVKDLPALRKQRFQAALYSAAPPDEAVCWCDVRCAPGAKVRHSALCAGMVELKRCDVSLNMQCHRPILSCYFTSHVRSSNSSKHSWLCMVRNTHIQAAYTAIKAASRRYIFFWSCMSLVQNRCRCLSSVGVRQYTGSVM